MSKDRILRRPDDSLDERKRQFRDLNAYITERGGWLTSIPGDLKMRLEALPGSPLPAQLTALGWYVERTGETQRILPNAVAQKLALSSSGALIAAARRPAALVVTGAGIAIVEQFELRRPPVDGRMSNLIG